MQNELYEEVQENEERSDEYDYFEVHEDLSRIALCTLGSLNWGAVRSPEELRKPCRILHRALHNILQYQDFLSVQSELHNEEFEPLGIGVTNLAYWHAKRHLKYGSQDALDELKSWIEHQTFYLTESNVALAAEKGKCKMSDSTCYGKGIFPWERRAKGVNELVDFTPDPDLDWETLRTSMLKHGVRNAVIGAIAPVESCEKYSNLINMLDGNKINYHELCEKAGLNWQDIESNNKIGFYYINPLAIVGPDGLEEQIQRIYYNGVSVVDEIEFEDGTKMSFTPGHRLLVNRRGIHTWVHVKDLNEGDEIVEIKDFRKESFPTA